MTISGELTRLYSFNTAANSGLNPYAALVLGSDGNFYGTASCYMGGGQGTVFRITANGTLTTLYSFTGGNDGESPQAALTFGSDGNLYGTTVGNIYAGHDHYGTVFRLLLPPVLTVQPQSRTNYAGETVSFTVSATSLNPIAYYWQKNGTNLVNGGNISGATSNILSMTAITGSDAASYSAIVNNANSSVTSSVATLTVVPLASAIVTIAPAAAVSAGARWAWDGGAWQDSGTILSNVPPGLHTVSYTPLNSWITPSNQVVTAISGQTTNVTATYIALGSLQVNITPVGALSAGAQWQVDGGAWQSSGTIISNLITGTHTVAFTNLAGWTPPPNQIVAVSLNQTTVATGVYVQQFGSLQVTLSPAGAIILGAQWQLDNGPWQNSGATVTNIPVATHTVSFAAIAGWTSPTSRSVVIASNQTAHITGIYQQQGALQVTIGPVAAVIAGAQWQLDGGAWQNSGTTLVGITVGAHSVFFKPIGGWVAPATQSVTILVNQTNAANAAYTDLAYSFLTIAGTAGSSAYADGTNATALFHTPVGIAVDSQTNLYIADTGNSVIRRLTPTTNSWVSSTIAGLAGNPGSADGTNSQAQFDYPSGVTVDTNGSIYVADQANSTVRKISAVGTNWVVSTIAGLAGITGSANGTNGAARFYYPASVAADLSGNVYVADQNNSVIRKMTPVGTNWAVTTIAGTAGVPGTANGTNASARFYWPSGVAVDTNGNIYVADTFNDTIRKITVAGTNYIVSTLCGQAQLNGSVDGTNNAARFDGPSGIAVDGSGNLYVADANSSVIRKLTLVGTNWVVNTIGGWAYVPGTADGTNSTARFNAPYGVCASTGGIIFVADTYNDTIRAGTPLYALPPIPSMTAMNHTAGTFGFSWSAQPGLFYQIQFRTNLPQTNWINLLGSTLATNWQMPFVDTAATNSQGFYRVLVLP